EVFHAPEPRVLARDDRAEHGGRHPGDPERHLVLEHLGGERERHVDRIDVARGERVDQGRRRPRHHDVLGLPAALAEEVLLVDDLARRPAELEVGEADLPLPGLRRGAPGPGRRRPQHPGSLQELPPAQCAHGSPPWPVGPTMTSASTATTCSPRAIRGFTSTSTISGWATTSSLTAIRTAASARSSAAGPPRKPRSTAHIAP